MYKTISILGVTGSIGKSALNICDNFNSEIKIKAFSVHRNVEKLIKLIDKYSPEYAVVSDEKAMKTFFAKSEAEHNGVKIFSGIEGLERICQDKDNDIIVNAIVGKAGLTSSINILTSGIDLALANKESIVCAGPILKELSRKYNSKIIPVDSEHSAIFHLLMNKKKTEIKNIYLTASGGPFLNKCKTKWHDITIEDALNHPTWQMGNKITIDSATMANKGLEVIEAHYLFDIDYSDIKVLIHPQSCIHSMIETIDSEVYAQLGPNDMSIPIQNAIFYPELKVNSYNKLDFSKCIKLELFPVDLEKFRMLQFAYECGRLGGLYPAFYNSVNERLVSLFLSDKISFLMIEEIMRKSLDFFHDDSNFDKNDLSLENIDITVEKADKIVLDILKREEYNAKYIK